MADILNRNNVDESFSEESLPVELLPEVFKDLKTTTVDATVKEIIESYLSKDIIEGIIEFPGQILRVEERRSNFQRSYLDNLGPEINRDFPRRYKVKVILIDDLKRTPEKFDETPEDKSRIDQYNDFLYIPSSFGNAEPMNVGDFVMVTYANLKAKTDGRILYKISGASHARGSVGRPEMRKAPNPNPRKAFEQKTNKPENQETELDLPIPETETKQNPPEPAPATPETKPSSLSDRPFKRAGWYSVSGSDAEFDAFKTAMTNRFPSWKTHIEDYNTDKTKRKNPNKNSIQFDMFNLDNEKKAKYHRAALSGKNGEDDVYIRALCDIIAAKESSMNYGWEMMYQADAHHDVDKQIGGEKTSYYLKEFGQYPIRYNVISAKAELTNVHHLKEFSDAYAENPNRAIRLEIKYATSAAGRYQILKGTWQDFSKGLIDFTPESQDESIYQILESHPMRTRGKDSKPNSSGVLFEGMPEKQREFNNASEEEKKNLRIKRIIELLKDGTEESIEKLSFSVSNIWTSIPGGIESSAKINYGGQNYTYSPKIFTVVYRKFLEDQKRPYNERKYTKRQEIFDEAIKELISLPEDKKLKSDAQLLKESKQKKAADPTPPTKPKEKK